MKKNKPKSLKHRVGYANYRVTTLLGLNASYDDYEFRNNNRIHLIHRVATSDFRVTTSDFRVTTSDFRVS